MDEPLLMIPVRDGLTILTREIDLVFDDDDGHYYLLNTKMREQSPPFSSGDDAVRALRAGNVRWSAL